MLSHQYVNHGSVSTQRQEEGALENSSQRKSEAKSQKKSGRCTHFSSKGFISPGNRRLKATTSSCARRPSSGFHGDIARPHGPSNHVGYTRRDGCFIHTFASPDPSLGDRQYSATTPSTCPGVASESSRGGCPTPCRRCEAGLGRSGL